MPRVILLGPQRDRPGIAGALESLGVGGQLAVVSAGWQEREAELRELREHVGRRALNLRLYARAERLFEEEPELFRTLRERQRRLRRLQRLYRARLAHLLDAARELFARREDPELLLPEREDAIAAIRRLDAHHLERVREIRDAVDEEPAIRRSPGLAREREAIARLVRRCQAVLIAGGHVAVLLNRMRLFRLGDLLGERPLIAWSAGAMVLTPRVVLFHDSPPQGPGNAEILDEGFGLCPGIVALPDASRRLELEDATRVAILARRCAPDTAVALDPGARILFETARAVPQIDAHVLAPTGRVARAAAS